MDYGPMQDGTLVSYIRMKPAGAITGMHARHAGQPRTGRSIGRRPRPWSEGIMALTNRKEVQQPNAVMEGHARPTPLQRSERRVRARRIEGIVFVDRSAELIASTAAARLRTEGHAVQVAPTQSRDQSRILAGMNSPFVKFVL